MDFGTTDEAIGYRVHTRAHDLTMSGTDDARRESLSQDDVLVAFLVSMGSSCGGERLYRSVAALTETAARLEEEGVRVLVLGYTTRTWRGGVSARDWKASGGTEHPGRLADLLHVVVKKAGDAVSPVALGLLARHDLRKESIDGEALQWAAEEVLASGAGRTAIVHVTDKFLSVDEATVRANRKGLLDDHARAVAAAIVSDGRIGISLAGVALNEGTVSSFLREAGPFYPAVEALDDQADVREISDLLRRSAESAVAAAPSFHEAPGGPRT